MTSIIADLPKGNPLDSYRKSATFDWKSLKLKVDGEDFVRLEKNLWEFIEKTPVFQRSACSTLDEQRRICNARIQALRNFSDIHPLVHPRLCNLLFEYDSSIGVKINMMNGMVPIALQALGTKDHSDIINNIEHGKNICCFAMTEISHGTNTKGIRTKATYDVKSKSFILHTEDFEAAKCWSGGLGTATHTVVFAQLITPDQRNHGLHAFVVPIRDPETYIPYEGVTLGDMGEKIGLNGVDNGFAIFNNYRIPKTCLLNRNANITEDGRYLTSVKHKNKRFGASLGALSSGRVMLTAISANLASLAITIAVRYCAVRKQFGPSETEEWPVIEYQVQQGRLFPHLAAIYAMKIFSIKVIKQTHEFYIKLMGGRSDDDVNAEGIEIHAVCSATKPLCTWTSRDIIQDCREACAGHGYLKISRLGDLRNENDVNCTFEGDNNVLTQQASNWLLNQWSEIISGKSINSPLKTVDFLNDANNILMQTFRYSTIDDTLKPENLLFCFKWLICYYLNRTYEQTQNLKRKGCDDFEIRNNTQVFSAQTLSLLYGQHAVMKYFNDRIQDSVWKSEERGVLTKLCSLYGAVALEKRLGDLYAGGYALPKCNMDRLLREGIIILCRDLVREAVALVDVLAPPDFILNSALGRADGQVYEHIKEEIFKNKENFARPSWWQEIRSKL